MGRRHHIHLNYQGNSKTNLKEYKKKANIENTIREYHSFILNGSNNSRDKNTGSIGAGNKESLEALWKTLKDKNDIVWISSESAKTIREFEGNVNPKTGEIDDPKQDPSRHGAWPYNGRIADI